MRCDVGDDAAQERLHVFTRVRFAIACLLIVEFVFGVWCGSCVVRGLWRGAAHARRCRLVSTSPACPGARARASRAAAGATADRAQSRYVLYWIKHAVITNDATASCTLQSRGAPVRRGPSAGASALTYSCLVRPRRVIHVRSSTRSWSAHLALPRHSNDPVGSRDGLWVFEAALAETL